MMPIYINGVKMKPMGLMEPDLDEGDGFAPEDSGLPVLETQD